MFQYVRCNHGIELPVGESPEVMNAPEMVREKGVINVKCGDAIATPAQNLSVQTLTRPDKQNVAAVSQRLQVAELIIRVDEVRQAQLAEPFFPVHGHARRLGMMQFCRRGHVRRTSVPLDSRIATSRFGTRRASGKRFQASTFIE